MRLKKSIEELVNEFKTVDWDAEPDRPDVATDDFFIDVVSKRFADPYDGVRKNLSDRFSEVTYDIMTQDGDIMRFSVTVDRLVSFAKRLAGGETKITARDVLLFCLGIKFQRLYDLLDEQAEAAKTQDDLFTGFLKTLFGGNPGKVN